MTEDKIHRTNETPLLEHVFSYPKPNPPDDASLIFMLVLTLPFLGNFENLPVFSWSFVFTSAALILLLYNWYKQRRKYIIALLEYRGASAQSWSKYFAQTEKEGVPDYHSLLDPIDPDGIFLLETARQGKNNHAIYARQCKEKIDIFKAKKWMLNAPILIEEKHQREQQKLRERQNREKIKTLKVGDKVRLLEEQDVVLSGIITSVNQNCDGIDVLWTEGSSRFIHWSEIDEYAFSNNQ
jgi:hypothetical protein